MSSKKSTKAPAATSAPAADDSLPQLRELIKSAQDVLHDQTLEEVIGDEGNGCYAWQLIFEARSLLEEHSNGLLTGVADNYYGDAILPALAMLLGARDMKGNHRALPAMLEPAIAALREAERIHPGDAHGGQERAGSAQTPGEAAIASPGPNTQAGEASEDEAEDPDAARKRIALRVCWEVDGLAKMAHAHLLQEDADEDYLPVRAMLRRMRRLASVQMSALTDPSEDVDSITARFEESDEPEAT